MVGLEAVANRVRLLVLLHLVAVAVVLITVYLVLHVEVEADSMDIVEDRVVLEVMVEVALKLANQLVVAVVVVWVELAHLSRQVPITEVLEVLVRHMFSVE